MTGDDLTAALRPVVEAFEQLGIPYAISGSVASSAYGAARTTLDIDLVAAVAPLHAEALAQRLAAKYYVDSGAIAEAVRCRTSFNVIHLDTMVKVDVFVPKQRAYDPQALERRRPERLGTDESLACFLASPEDVVLSKLEWFRLGGEVSERQWRDVLAVMQVQRERLDLAYLRRWAPALAVADLLERAVAEATGS